MFIMSCRRTSSLLVIALVISLLLLDRPIAHARHLKNTSMSSRGSSTERGLEDSKKKLDEEKTKKLEAVQVGSNSVHGGSPDVHQFAKIVVVERRGPTPHPKKHNL
uniref:Uncharacterized protein n=1 Tax=Oryza barthii TaxID=65489 RepID=A0A0D3F6X8_9ORYZ